MTAPHYRAEMTMRFAISDHITGFVDRSTMDCKHNRYPAPPCPDAPSDTTHPTT